ncbi:hypothetical protein A3C17_02460 [Candidatus Uhrbacteria bacterium RIFCSPHIGHO2_02_FULL_53_13]|uniref:DUF2489 domain-containing protein n=2 Tax=Candidatus Uhriibacteriota TaxID=1752732 RepID=A0A1F7U1J2_9BACT|nr:MAG: hypothetical protein A3C17_02460 [Candidatus Uhrbacteria bacterium RIFCSPHIGHO2_02_FULL_53_13]OGL88817.1 MAG: hypothetical protein A3I45_03535 [Candidatus Uhrbacteria bacterium RIFCSPLOWO2_02_FULL_53_10]
MVVLFVAIAVLGFAIVVWIVYMAYAHVRRFSSQVKSEALDREAVARKMEEIEHLMQTPTRMAHRVALQEADKLLDYCLKALGISGNTTLERLSEGARVHRSLRKMITVRSRIEPFLGKPHMALAPSQVEDAMHQYRKAFKTLGVMG